MGQKLFFEDGRRTKQRPVFLTGQKTGIQKERTTRMKKRCCTTRLSCLFFLGMMSFLWACSPTMDSQANHESKTTETAMNLAHKIETESPAIPPIDAAAPAIFETASFGLG
jgi:hypothetical protein